MGMPADVRRIDPDQAIGQAPRKATDAALGEVGPHRRAETDIARAGGEEGAELEAHALEDFLVKPGRKMALEQVEGCDCR
jgi:hypothetical protein